MVCITHGTVHSPLKPYPLWSPEQWSIPRLCHSTEHVCWGDATNRPENSREFSSSGYLAKPLSTLEGVWVKTESSVWSIFVVLDQIQCFSLGHLGVWGTVSNFSLHLDSRGDLESTTPPFLDLCSSCPVGDSLGDSSTAHPSIFFDTWPSMAGRWKRGHSHDLASMGAWTLTRITRRLIRTN